MVSDNTVSHVHVVHILFSNLASVGTNARLLLNSFDDRHEDICVVVGRLVLED